MCWVVQIPVKGQGGEIVIYERHEFKTKAQAKKFQKGLKVYSEMFHLRKAKV